MLSLCKTFAKMRKLFLLLTASLLLAACGKGNRYIQVTGHAQGGVYSVKINMEGVNVSPDEIRDSVAAILENIDTTLSGYNKGSLLSKFNAGQPVTPNALFLDTYLLARKWYARSGGILDCAAGPLFDAWGFGFREGKLPSDEKVQEILKTSGMNRLWPRMRPRPDGKVYPQDLLIEGEVLPQLNYTAIAQGYTADLVAGYLYRIGVKDMLVDIGEIWCDGRNPSGQPWSVGVDRPFDRPLDGSDQAGAQLSGVWTSGGFPRGIVTSGNYRKYYVEDGKKYAHTIDPRSGYPVRHNLLSATVVSQESSASADALATWCMVVGLEEAQRLILGDAALEGYLVYTDESGEMAEWSSPGFTLTSTE